jgi:REP element-mobilizing transposase RayT
MRKTKFKKDGVYHIYNRGNRKKNIFLDEEDYETFIRIVEVYCEKFDIQIITYCLMPNHYHLVLKQRGDKSVSVLMHRVGITYTLFFNRKYDQVGHLFQGKFQSRAIEDDNDLKRTLEYVINNPVKDRLVNSWRYYKWSYLTRQFNHYCSINKPLI